MADIRQTAANPSDDFIRATPRSPVLGYLADLTASTYSPQRTQQMQGVAKFLGASEISQTLDRMAYGQPLTTGSGGIGGTSKIRPEVAEAAMSLMDFLPTSGIAKGAALAAPAIGGMIIGKGGKLSSSLEDAMLASEKIKSLGAEFIPKIEQASGGSVYLTVSKQQFTKSGEPSKRAKPVPIDFKARFADHPSYWGSSISSDPVTGNDVDTVVKMFESKIGRGPEPEFSIARFNPADKYGTVQDVRFIEGLSHRGNPVIKRTVESRPFTFFEPKTSWDATAAQKAKMLADIGTDPKTIWEQTGTWKGPDGKWRQELINQGIPDTGQAFTDVERMAKEYGYEGAANPEQGTAILFGPTAVKRAPP